MKKQSFMIGIHVLAKLGKQFCIESICLNVVDGLYDWCKLVFHGNKYSPEAQSLSHAIRSNRIEGFLLYLRDEFASKPKHCLTTINAGTHKFFSSYTIVAINVKTTLNTSSGLHVIFRGLKNSISTLIET